MREAPFWWQRLTGLDRWRVIYHDGQRSVPLRRETAKALRDVFGGTLEPVRRAGGAPGEATTPTEEPR